MSYLPKAILRRRRKPFLLWAAPPVLALGALPPALFVLLIALDGGGRDLSLGSQPIGAREFFGLVLPVTLLASGIQLAGACGLYAERLWARPAVALWPIALYALLLAGTSVHPLGLLDEAWPGLVWMAAVVWYFYRYPPVVEYYRGLRKRG